MQEGEDDPPDLDSNHHRSSQMRYSCPLCSLAVRDTVALFQHINACHITRHSFPDMAFLEFHQRHLCCISCGFAYAARFERCRRSLVALGVVAKWLFPSHLIGYQRLQSWIHLYSLEEKVQTAVDDVEEVDSHLNTQDRMSSLGTSFQTKVDIPQSSSVGGTLLDGLTAASLLSASNSDESMIFGYVMEDITSLGVHTVAHVPRSVRPLLSSELYNACVHGLWGFVRLSMLPKCVLRSPLRGGRKKRVIVNSILLSRLRRWQQGDLIDLWMEARAECSSQHPAKPTTQRKFNATRAINLAQEGRYGDALRSLRSTGCASHNDKAAVEDLLQRHPQQPLHQISDNKPAALVVDSASIISALKQFPRGSSHGASKLRSQHLLDSITSTVAPASQTCLENLTKLVNCLLAGKLDTRISPWLVGAPLTALLKNSGGIRPIAVGEVIRRLASRVCCAAVKPRTPDVLLPYGQIGVGVKGGLEAGVHTVRSFIHKFGNDEELCCFKTDMSNAFNEWRRSTFVHRLRKEFPELVAWVEWCYCFPEILRFGSHTIASSAGVQQGDP